MHIHHFVLSCQKVTQCKKCFALCFIIFSLWCIVALYDAFVALYDAFVALYDAFVALYNLFVGMRACLSAPFTFATVFFISLKRIQ